MHENLSGFMFCYSRVYFCNWRTFMFFVDIFVVMKGFELSSLGGIDMASSD